MTTMEATIKTENGELTILANPWEKGAARRLYFSIKGGYRNSGQACWDLNARNWVKVHGEFGPAFKDRIADAFGLGDMI